MANIPDAPGEWTHKRGELHDRDGGSITYSHPSGLKAFCEVNSDPDEPYLIYRPSVVPEDSGPLLEYPPKISVGDGHSEPRQAALDQLVEWMNEYPTENN